MKKFQFKLQAVLHFRQRKEDILKKELAEIKKAFDFEKHKLDKLKSKLSKLQIELREKQLSSFDVSVAKAYSSYIDKIEADIELQSIKLADIAKEVKKAQERLLKASRDKKVLEKLHDKKYEEYRQEFERVEQGLIDEIATIRHSRQDTLPLKEH